MSHAPQNMTYMNTRVSTCIDIYTLHGYIVVERCGFSRKHVGTVVVVVVVVEMSHH